MAVHSRFPDAGPESLRLHGRDDPQRAEVERFIRRVYAQRYGATVAGFAPTLVSLAHPDGSIAAAAGYRGAASGPLFLERYLGRPIEEVLAERGGSRPARAQVVEIGHLASGHAGAGRRLIFLLAPQLARERFRWATATLTRELLQLFGRLGLAPLALASADPAALGDEARLWGSYYEHDPVVLAGEIRPALVRLARRDAASGAGEKP